MKEDLYADYLAEIDFTKFKSADVIVRRNYFFVDVTYNGKDKDTNFRFDTAEEANQFLDIVNKKYYLGNKPTYSFIAGVVAGFAIALLLQLLT